MKNNEAPIVNWEALNDMTKGTKKQINALKTGIFDDIEKDITDIIKSKMFLSILFAPHSLTYRAFCMWIKHKVPKLRNIDHIMLAMNGDSYNVLANNYDRLEKQLKLSPVYPIVCKISKYGWIVIKSNKTLNIKGSEQKHTITAYFIGKDAYKNRHEYIQCYYRYIKYRDKLNSNKIIFSEIDNHGTVSGYSIHKKSREDIVWDKLDELSNYVLQWSKMRDDYISRHLPYKLSILLYGKPGTGKSSICNYIAGITNREIVIIRPSISINSLKDALRYESERILLFEDIDIFFEQAQSCTINMGNNATMDNMNDKLHYLLQMFSGMDTPNNIIIICTTNYPDKIDERLLRPGRFDLKYEIPEFNKKNAIEMCEMYDVPQEELLKDMGDTINPSELWTKCMQYSIQERIESIKKNLS